MLTATLGIVVVVRKSRRLFLHKGVRIHLDRVEGLGCFIELEGVTTSRKPDPAQFRKLLDDLSNSFGIEHADLIASSYCDLALAAAATA